MAEGVNDDMWTLYKELCSTVELHLTHPTDGPHTVLESVLRKHRQHFMALLENTPPSAASRDELCGAVTSGIILPGVGHTILSKELIDEAVIISDMYQLNEYVALELLCTAQRQMPYHPGLPRGLVAILLYYDGRKAVVSALRTLVQSRKGVSWCTQCPETLTQVVTNYTDQLVSGGLLNRIIDLLTTLDITKEIELLQRNRGIGPPKHHRQILDLYEDTRVSLAGCLYSWSAQTGLPKETTLRLINHLKTVKMEESTSCVDDVTLTLVMALLYALDLSVLHKREDGEELVENLPIVAENGFVAEVLESLTNTRWENEGLRALALFAFGVALASLRLAPQSMHPPGFVDQDDLLIGASIDMKVFDFMHHTFLENKTIFKEEFFLRKMHNLLTDFIELKYSKVMELRTKADETSRTIDMYAQEGLEPPQHLSYDFEMFLLSIAKLYNDNSQKLDLCIEYWGPQDNTGNFNSRTSLRTVSLFKFVRLAGDLIPNTLLQSYLDMIASLSGCPVAARQAFNLLKMNNQGAGMTVSWDHFFNSLGRYYSNLRQIQMPRSETSSYYMTTPRGVGGRGHQEHPHHAASSTRHPAHRHGGGPGGGAGGSGGGAGGGLVSGIQPKEISALMSVLKVIQSVATHDEVARIALCEHPGWSPVQVLLGLVTCSVPVYFKAELLRTLASLGSSPQTAATVWCHMETAQILATIPSTSSYRPRGVQTELEEIETRNEEYPLTRAFLRLLRTLSASKSAVPKNLGQGTRTPGLNPYLSFVVESVFLRFNARSYKAPEEKWQVAEECLALLETYLDQYEPLAEDFPTTTTGGNRPQQVNPPPGFHIMIQMNTKSEFLRVLLDVLDESCQIFDSYNSAAASYPGREHLENCALGSLNMINRAMVLQQRFFGLLSATGCSLLLTNVSKLLLDINPRSGKPDHVLNVARYLTYNWLPLHARTSVRILLAITSAVPSANPQLLSVFTQSAAVKTEIRHGFVECLENEDDNYKNGNDDDDGSGCGSEISTKESILRLLMQCLNQSTPNLAHYLFGFDLSKSIEKTSFQQAGMLGFPRTCLHSLIFILDSGIKKGAAAINNAAKAGLLKTAYQMLYMLCANPKTSEPVLRFLRNCNEFLARHAAALPFKADDKPAAALNQMSWLMKTVAIELKMTAKNHQSSQFANISKVLLGVSPENSDNSKDAANNAPLTELSHYCAYTMRNENSHNDKNHRHPNQHQHMLVDLINHLDFDMRDLPAPQWNFFDCAMLEAIFKNCSVPAQQHYGGTGGGPRLIDVKSLHQTLLDELSTIQGTTVIGQRPLIMQEIEQVLRYAVQYNNHRSLCSATVNYADAWRQMTEVVFSVAPTDAVSNDVRQLLLLEIAQAVLKKSVTITFLTDLSNIASSCLLMLLINLRHCYILKQKQKSLRLDYDLSVTSDVNVNTNTLSLKFILENVIQWVTISGVDLQKLRINLYGSFLNIVHLISSHHNYSMVKNSDAQQQQQYNDSLYVGRLDSSRVNLSVSEESALKEMAVGVLVNSGDRFIDILCHDLINGHDISRMLALCCLNILIDLNAHSLCISYLSRKGYLKHMIDSLLENDNELIQILQIKPLTMKPLYLYESKMALLGRVASTHIGAELLLEQNILTCLASMRVFDIRPEQQQSHGNNKDGGDNKDGGHFMIDDSATSLSATNFIPSLAHRFQQIIFPALGICDAILTTLGTDNHSVVLQVQHFIFSHFDTVEIILRGGNAFLNLGHLKELAQLTGVIARSANLDVTQSVQENYSVHLHRLQRIMLSLLPRFALSDSLLRNIQPNKKSMVEQQKQYNSTGGGYRGAMKSERTLKVIEIACNLCLYSRNIIANNSVDHHSVGVLFLPTLNDTIAGGGGGAAKKLESNAMGVYGNLEQGPSLGVIVSQLNYCVQYYLKEKSTLRYLLKQKRNIPEMSTAELSEYLSDRTEMVAIGQGREIALEALTGQISLKQQEMSQVTFLIENCLYLIWAHLDYYMLRAIPMNNVTSFINNTTVPSTTEVSWNVSTSDVSLLSQGLVGVLNEKFCKDLIATTQDLSPADKSFLDSLLRRIKRLIQFVPVK